MSTNKPWERPWSMEEIIDNSDKWSLAGDVALLNTLKSFADNLLSKTTEINNNLHNLTNNLEETSLQLNIAQNEFQSLRNSQFIESRVYEDDETLPQVENVEKVEEKTEINHIEDIRLAALKGLKVLDHYFDKIEVSVSDSEDDDIDLPNYVLRPKDLYLDRPLPYVIGSEEWHKSLHVGLEVSSSDSETENVSDKFSESDSESDLQAIQDRSQIKETSDTSSEFDFLQKIENKQVKQDLFQSSDSEDQNSIPVQAPISNKNFAEELATKLGNVINQEVVEPEVNRRPIQTKSHYGDLFFDEPPPLDENKGLFSGGSGLFDDDDDDDAQYSTPTESKIEESPKLSKPTSLFDDSDDDIFGGKKQFLQSSKPPLISEEPPALQEKKKPVGGVSIFGNTNLFDKKLLKRQPSSGDEEEDTKESKTGKKIDLFDDGDLFKEAKSVNKSENIPTKKINLFDSDDEDRRDDGYIKPKETKKISLFDDDDDLFKDDLFSANTTTTTTKKFGSGLFDDIDTHDDLFETKTESKPSRNLFDDLMSTPDNKNSINSDTKIDKKDEKNVAVVSGESSGGSKPPVHSLFGSSPETTDSLFGDLDNAKSENPEAPKPKPRVSLFDSPLLEPDDLFASEYPTKKETIEDIPKSNNPTTSSIFNDADEHPTETTEERDKTTTTPIEPPKKTEEISSGIFNSSLSCDLFGEKPQKPPEIIKKPNLFSSSTPEAKILPDMRLFDPSPPPDDEWETKSENSDELDSFTDLEEAATQKSTLFSEEPPSLSLFGKVSNITERFEKEPQDERRTVASSPGKLKHNLNINVGALMPGSARPKRGEFTQKAASVESAEERSFDETDAVEVLHSVTKDRARVPLNRRPSTRRGRKAALKNSSTDFKLEQDEEVPQTKSENSPPSSLFGPIKSDQLFEVNSTKPPPKADLFDSQSDHLFEVKSTKPPSKTDLFDDDDDDDEDDMFSSKKTSVQVAKTAKKSLFDDDENDDDDDIFKSFATASTVKRPESKLAAEKKIPKVSSVKKLENTKPDEDPLSAFLK